MLLIHRLSSNEQNFYQELEKILTISNEQNVIQQVSDIINQVRTYRDLALVELTNKFDNTSINNAEQLKISIDILKQAADELEPLLRETILISIERVKIYHEAQKHEPFTFVDNKEIMLGQRVTPIQRVGLYVPGGTAAYPSSVIMNAIPAKVAGVVDIAMVTPMSNNDGKNTVNKTVLACAYLCGITEVYTVGGAQAIAALAYGTQTIKKVNKIVGPGNAYVAEAKRQVFGQVGIDMIAGPSEILIICDGSVDPNWIAMDLCSQAEHDKMARSVLLSPDKVFLEEVYMSLSNLLNQLPRKDIIKKSFENHGALIHVQDLQQAIEIANFIAPEHLEIACENADSYLDKIINAGAIFLGSYTPEAFGDYVAGPSHVLPTISSASFSSPLSIYDFQKRSSIIKASKQGAHKLARWSSVLARAEGLTAHALSAEYRLGDVE